MRFRAAVFVAVITLPCALGLSWLGCAGGDEEVTGTPKRNTGDTSLPEGGGDDTGIGPTTDTGGPGTDTAKPPLCPGEVGTPNSCATATDLGSLALAGTKSIADSLPIMGGDLWYKVKFESLDDLTVHPRIRITSSDPAIVLEITKTCAGDTVNCGDEDAFATRIKDYEVVYRPDPSADGGYESKGDAFLPVLVGEGGTVYIRVFRTTGAPSACNFQLDLSN